MKQDLTIPQEFHLTQTKFHFTPTTQRHSRCLTTNRVEALRSLTIWTQKSWQCKRPFRCTNFCCPCPRQEVREWKSNPLFLPDPTLHRMAMLLPKLQRRGFPLALPVRMEDWWGGGNQIISPKKNHKGLFLMGSCSSMVIGGSSTD